MIINILTILGVLMRPAVFALYFLSGFAPRSPRRWVFGSWNGRLFGDNPAALFEYVQSLDSPGVTLSWISGDRRVVRELRERGYVAHLRWSPRGMLACLKAGVFVVDGFTRDINHWLSRGASIVLLRHGVGFKKVERAIEHPGHRLYKLFHGRWWERAAWSYLLPWHLVRPDLMIATSPDHVAQGQQFYDVPADSIVITGFPRNDSLLSKSRPALDPQVRALAEEADRRGLPVFAYMPTFRDDNSCFEFPLQELEEIASGLGIMLAVKLHIVDGIRMKSYVPKVGGNLELLDSKIDASQIFPIAAGLITDYSSVVFDFILTNKPAIFFVPDLDEYLRYSRSFYYDFEEITPGPKTRTLDELEQAIAAAVKEGQGAWHDRYESILSRFHTHRDSGSSQRVYHAILERFLPDASPHTKQY